MEELSGLVTDCLHCNILIEKSVGVSRYKRDAQFPVGVALLHAQRHVPAHKRGNSRPIYIGTRIRTRHAYLKTTQGHTLSRALFLFAVAVSQSVFLLWVFIHTHRRTHSHAQADIKTNTGTGSRLFFSYLGIQLKATKVKTVSIIINDI